MTDGKNPTNTFEYVWDRVFDTADKVISQMTSGRWILTVAAAIILVNVCWNNVNNAIQFKEIIAVIIYAYFQRGDRNQEKNGGTNEQKN